MQPKNQIYSGPGKLSFFQKVMQLALWQKAIILAVSLVLLVSVGTGLYFALRKSAPTFPVSQAPGDQLERPNSDSQLQPDASEEAKDPDQASQNQPPTSGDSSQPGRPGPSGSSITPTPSPNPGTPPTTPPTDPPPSGGFPNDSNTGVPAGTSLSNYTGPSVNNSSGIVLENLNFTGTSGYEFNGNNITIRNSYFHSGVTFRGDNLVIERSTIIDGASFSGTAGVIFRYNNVKNFAEDALHVTSDNGRVSNVTITGNFINSSAPQCGAHADGLHVRGVGGLTVTGNVFDLGPWRQVCGLDVLNSAIFLQNTQGGNQNVTVSGNYLNGGSNIMYIDPGSNLRVTNNAFGRDEGYGVVENTSNPGDLVDKSGNYRLNDNEPVNF